MPGPYLNALLDSSLTGGIDILERLGGFDKVNTGVITDPDAQIDAEENNLLRQAIRDVVTGLKQRAVSVQWFGAVGDGATADQVAVQTACDWAAANGMRTVYFPKTASSTYKLARGGTEGLQFEWCVRLTEAHRGLALQADYGVKLKFPSSQNVWGTGACAAGIYLQPNTGHDGEGPAGVAFRGLEIEGDVGDDLLTNDRYAIQVGTRFGAADLTVEFCKFTSCGPLQYYGPISGITQPSRLIFRSNHVRNAPNALVPCHQSNIEGNWFLNDAMLLGSAAGGIPTTQLTATSTSVSANTLVTGTTLVSGAHVNRVLFDAGGRQWLVTANTTNTFTLVQLSSGSTTPNAGSFTVRTGHTTQGISTSVAPNTLVRTGAGMGTNAFAGDWLVDAAGAAWLILSNNVDTFTLDAAGATPAAGAYTARGAVDYRSHAIYAYGGWASLMISTNQFENISAHCMKLKGNSASFDEKTGLMVLNNRCLFAGGGLLEIGSLSEVVHRFCTAVGNVSVNAQIGLKFFAGQGIVATGNVIAWDWRFTGLVGNGFGTLATGISINIATTVGDSGGNTHTYDVSDNIIASLATCVGILQFAGQPTAGKVVMVGPITYTWVSGTPKSDKEVQIGSSTAVSAQNLRDKIVGRGSYSTAFINSTSSAVGANSLTASTTLVSGAHVGRRLRDADNREWLITANDTTTFTLAANGATPTAGTYQVFTRGFSLNPILASTHHAWATTTLQTPVQVVIDGTDTAWTLSTDDPNISVVQAPTSYIDQVDKGIVVLGGNIKVADNVAYEIGTAIEASNCNSVSVTNNRVFGGKATSPRPWSLHGLGNTNSSWRFNEWYPTFNTTEVNSLRRLEVNDLNTDISDNRGFDSSTSNSLREFLGGEGIINVGDGKASAVIWFGQDTQSSSTVNPNSEWQSWSDPYVEFSSLSTATGANSLTDSAQSMATDQFKDFWLRDSAGTYFRISTNNATVFTLVASGATPASGNYSVVMADVVELGDTAHGATDSLVYRRTAMLTASSTSVGANSLTTGTALVSGAYVGKYLRDSAGALWPIASNDTTTFTLTAGGATPAAGSFTVYQPFEFNSLASLLSWIGTVGAGARWSTARAVKMNGTASTLTFDCIVVRYAASDTANFGNTATISTYTRSRVTGQLFGDVPRTGTENTKSARRKQTATFMGGCRGGVATRTVIRTHKADATKVPRIFPANAQAANLWKQRPVVGGLVKAPTTASTVGAGAPGGTVNWRVDVEALIARVGGVNFESAAGVVGVTQDFVVANAAISSFDVGDSVVAAVVLKWSAGTVSLDKVLGTSAVTGSQVPPTDAAIQTALGASVLFLRLANCTLNRTADTTVTQSQDNAVRLADSAGDAAPYIDTAQTQRGVGYVIVHPPAIGTEQFGFMA